MNTLLEFLYKYKAILGAIGIFFDIGLQFAPVARQFGEIIGNLSLALAWVMLSALALIWVDKWTPQLHGWRLSLLKIGLRASVLFTLFVPLLTFNPSITQPTIKIITTRVSTYEVGKPVAVELKIQNNSYSAIKLHGHYNVLVATKGTNSWPAIEEMIWGAMTSRPESDYPEFTIPTSDVHPRVVLDGPVLTREQVDGLRKTDDTSAIYFLGVFTYSEWYGRSRRLEFCGSYKDRPTHVYACAKHPEWAEGLRGK